MNKPLPSIQSEKTIDSRAQLRDELHHLRQELVSCKNNLTKVAKRLELIERVHTEKPSGPAKQLLKDTQVIETPVKHTAPQIPVPAKAPSSTTQINEAAKEGRRKRRRRRKTKKTLISGYIAVIGIFLLLAFALVMKNLFSPMF